MHLGRLIDCPLPYTGKGAEKKVERRVARVLPHTPFFLFAHVAQRIKSW